MTLRNLWAMGYQVIVSYEHKLASGQNDLWAHIPYWWANKCKAEALIQEFEQRKQHGRPGNFPQTFAKTEASGRALYWKILCFQHKGMHTDNLLLLLIQSPKSNVSKGTQYRFYLFKVLSREH